MDEEETPDADAGAPSLSRQQGQSVLKTADSLDDGLFATLGTTTGDKRLSGGSASSKTHTSAAGAGGGATGEGGGNQGTADLEAELQRQVQ